MSKLSFHIKDFRAISNADIKLDGITVISGINGAGKSTLSQLLYNAVKLTIELEDILQKNLIHELGYLFSTLSKVSDDYQVEKSDFLKNNENNIYEAWLKRARSVDLESINRVFNNTLNDIVESFLKREDQKPFTENEISRIRYALGLVDPDENSEQPINNISDLFMTLRNIVDEYIKKTLHDIKLRPLNEAQSRLNYTFNESIIPLSLYEDGMPIIDYKSKRINNIFSVKQVYYSDTPMAISDRRESRADTLLSNTPHWDFLRQTILEKPTIILNNKQKEVYNEIENIIKGNISLEVSQFDRKLKYKREDGLEIDLKDSATGIKSFALLQLLLSEGLLNEKTLLILDEPEVHLHPHWIVEYARILILLNKKLGVKFMVASHNPDMVSALRYISEKEGILNNMQFYLAEKVKGTEQFNYLNLENDIEPIFTSFNIALDRINQYGV